MPVNRVRPKLPAAWKSLAGWLLPTRCLICGEAAGELDLCRACDEALARNAPACPICALPLVLAAPACGACLQRMPPFSRLLAPWRYEGAIAHLLPRFKFHRDLAAGHVLIERTLPELDAWEGWHGVTRVVPMPLHVTRLGQRGYNQALELARPLARARGLPLAIDTLVRTRATQAQTELDAVARRRNLRGAFAAKPLPGGIVLLVDDVVTTTATLAEATRTLLRAGADEVRAVAIARAPPP